MYIRLIIVSRYLNHNTAHFFVLFTWNVLGYQILSNDKNRCLSIYRKDYLNQTSHKVYVDDGYLICAKYRYGNRDGFCGTHGKRNGHSQKYVVNHNVR